MSLRAFGEARTVDESYTGLRLRLDAKYNIDGFFPYNPDTILFDLPEWSRSYGRMVADAIFSKAFDDIKEQNGMHTPLTRPITGNVTADFSIENTFDENLKGFIGIQQIVRGPVDIRMSGGGSWRELIYLARTTMAKEVARLCVQEMIRKWLKDSDFQLRSPSVTTKNNQVTEFEYLPKLNVARLLKTEPKQEEIPVLESPEGSENLEVTILDNIEE